MTPSCHRHRWNITIVVLLLMVASGLLALLTLQFVKHFLVTANRLDSYYKAYYMARGWLEALLTESHDRGYGFQYDLWQTTLQENYYNNCSSKQLCTIRGQIVSHWPVIADSVQSLETSSCDTNMIVLQAGRTNAYPLFYDQGRGSDLSFQPVAGTDYTRLNHKWFAITVSGWDVETFLYDAWQGSFGKITSSQLVREPGDLSLFAQQSTVHTHWLIITNPNDTDAVSYCLKSDDAAHKLVGNFTRIISQATYSNKTVGLTAVKKFVFPSAFIQ